LRGALVVAWLAACSPSAPTATGADGPLLDAAVTPDGPPPDAAAGPADAPAPDATPPPPDASPPDATPVGTLHLTWDITFSGAPSTCAAVNGATVELAETPAAGGTTTLDRFSCAAMAGTSRPLVAGSYQVAIRLLDNSDQPESDTAKATVPVVAGQSTDLDHFTFKF
jgi:hypothetical protein